MTPSQLWEAPKGAGKGKGAGRGLGSERPVERLGSLPIVFIEMKCWPQAPDFFNNEIYLNCDFICQMSRWICVKYNVECVARIMFQNSMFQVQLHLVAVVV